MSAGKMDVTNDYTPDGRKLSSRHQAFVPKGKANSYTLILTTDRYVDGLILRNGTPFMWQFDGGYVSLDANGAPTSWNYYVTDHLGSTRKVVGSDNSIKETINYYPFGSEMRMQDPAQMIGNTWQPYRFTGKELDNQNGLNWYDFGARWYDVAGVPMWTSVDPLAEKYYHISPYAYCAGDPVNKFDPDGRKVVIWYGIKGHEKCFTFTGFHGKKSIRVPNNPFVKAVIQAYVYDCRNGGGKAFRNAVHRKEKIYVDDARIYTEGVNRFTVEGHQPTVHWNPDNGIKTTEGGAQSPATIIEHEMDHANDNVDNSKIHSERRDSVDSQFDNKEERRVITGSEAETAQSNGESIRKDHKGTLYRTVSPTSIKSF